MYRGRIVEVGPVDAIFASARHPYTRALLSSVPTLDPAAARRRTVFDPASHDIVTLQMVGVDHFAAV